MNIRILILIASLTGISALNAQDRFTSQPVIWFTATEQLIFNDYWNAKFNVQQRQFIETKGSFQFLVSGTLDRRVSKKLSVGAGLMFFDFRTTNPNSDLIDLPELRTYEYIAANFTVGATKMYGRLLLEQRFQKWLTTEGDVGKNYRLNHRLRLKWQATIPIGEKLSAIVSDEPMINFGPDIVNNTFDQNRLIFMASYKIRDRLSVGSGYMNWIFQRSSGNSFDIRHVWLIQLSHQFNL